MTIITPMHQFEVRYSSILDFPNVIGEALAPFIKLSSKVNIEHEYSHKQRIILQFAQDFYTITVSWDRIIIQTNGFSDGLNENNSIVENPFFDIIAKIKNLKAFGEINNILFFTMILNIKDKDLMVIKKNFYDKYFCSFAQGLLPSIEDSALVLEHHKDKYQIHLSIGPYSGAHDLKKRSITVSNPKVKKEEIESYGEMIEFKYYEELKTISFSKYKEISKIQNENISKIWKD